MEPPDQDEYNCSADPAQSWYTHSAYGALLAGLVPFAVLFIELMFVFKSLWQDKSGYYYVFGFLSVVSAILIITVSEVTIIATYIQLCSEVSSVLSFLGSCALTNIRLELPLVVAELLRWRRQRILDLHLLRVVLRDTTAH